MRGLVGVGQLHLSLELLQQNGLPNFELYKFTPIELGDGCLAIPTCLLLVVLSLLGVSVV